MHTATLIQIIIMPPATASYTPCYHRNRLTASRRKKLHELRGVVHCPYHEVRETCALREVLHGIYHLQENRNSEISISV